MYTITRSVATVFVAAFAAAGWAGTATAATVAASVVVDLDDTAAISLTKDGESYTGSITVTNPTDENATVTLTTPEDCTWTAAPEEVLAGRQSSVTLTISDCLLPTDTNAPGSLSLGADTMSVTFKVTESTPAPLSTITQIFGAAALIAAFVLLYVSFSVGLFSPKAGQPTWSTHITGLSTTWSPDSWATNLTVASTAAVALFGASDALTALLGEEPKATVAHMLVAGLASAFLVALSAVLMKSVSSGDDSTVGATILGGAVTLTATLGLIGNLAYATWTALPEYRLGIVITCAALGVLAIWYTIATLGGLLNMIVSSTAPAVSDTGKIAAAVSLTQDDGTSVEWSKIVVRRAKELDAASTADAGETRIRRAAGATAEPRFALSGAHGRRSAVL